MLSGIKSVCPTLSELRERLIWSRETKMEKIHVRFSKIHIRFWNYSARCFLESNLYVQLFLSFENDQFEVERPKWRNPRKIFRNPHQIFKISTKIRFLQKSELSTPPELRERSVWSLQLIYKDFKPAGSDFFDFLKNFWWKNWHRFHMIFVLNFFKFQIDLAPSSGGAGS